MGLPFYALLVEASCASKPWTLPTREPERNDVLYNDIVSIQSKFTVYRDPASMAPWLFDGTTFWDL